MVFMGASNRLYRTRRATYQHVLEDVSQYHPSPLPPSPMVELKRRFEWSALANTDNIPTKNESRVVLPKQVKSNLFCSESGAGRLTSSTDAHLPDLEDRQRADDDHTTAHWLNSEDPCSDSFDKYNAFDHDLYESRSLLSLTPSISSSSGGSSSSWIPPDDDEADMSLIHLAQDTLQYIHSFHTYSDELASLASKLDDYLEHSW